MKIGHNQILSMSYIRNVLTFVGESSDDTFKLCFFETVQTSLNLFKYVDSSNVQKVHGIFLFRFK